MNHILHLAAHFREMGHEVKIIAPSSNPDAATGNPDLIICGRPYAVPANGSTARIALSLRLSKQGRKPAAQIPPPKPVAAI